MLENVKPLCVSLVASVLCRVVSLVAVCTVVAGSVQVTGHGHAAALSTGAFAFSVGNVVLLLGLQSFCDVLVLRAWCFVWSDVVCRLVI